MGTFPRESAYSLNVTEAVSVPRPLRWLLTIALFLAAPWVLRAEKVETMPAPTGYVNDFAGVIDDQSKQQIAQLCTALDQQAHAQVAIVTIHSLEGAEAADFTTRLEEKWGVGDKKTDRGLIMLFSIEDRKRFILVGYGLQGILNDAKVGDIGRSMVPQLQQAQYGPAIYGGLKQIADDIAADSNVTLNVEPYHTPRQYHRTTQTSPGSTVFHILFFLFIVIVIFGMSRGGRGGRGGGGSGLGWFLLGNFLGSSGVSRGGWGGGGDWGGGGGSSGGGFGGFGGGGSDGGGAGGSW